MRLFRFSARVLALILALSAALAAAGRLHVTGHGSAVARAPWLMQQVGNSPEGSQAEAKALVEKYWSGEPAARYALLTKGYRLGLRRLGITNAANYGVATQPPERIWGKRTYQKVDVTRDRQGRHLAQVVLLIDWEQEGYRGVMTYIFDLILESGDWKISNIVH